MEALFALKISALIFSIILIYNSLHSHDLNWASGSHQQSVTSVKDINDPNSLWLIKEKHGAEPCETGTPIICNQEIKLEHVNTGKNLHSHEFDSMLSGAQEVSAFAGDDWNGDENDNMRISCLNPDKDNILRGKTLFHILHLPTKTYIFIDKNKSMFNQYNCQNCPIHGQREVSAVPYKSPEAIWKISGVSLLDK